VYLLPSDIASAMTRDKQPIQPYLASIADAETVKGAVNTFDVIDVTHGIA
jgi:hypothetical protein